MTSKLREPYISLISELLIKNNYFFPRLTAMNYAFIISSFLIALCKADVSTAHSRIIRCTYAKARLY